MCVCGFDEYTAETCYSCHHKVCVRCREEVTIENSDSTRYYCKACYYARKQIKLTKEQIKLAKEQIRLEKEAIEKLNLIHYKVLSL